MAIIVLLVIIAAIVGGVSAGLTIVANLGSIAARRDSRAREFQTEAQTQRAISKTAMRALYRIADPSCGAPMLEAQNALSDIDNLQTKELN
jgi:hypothetical protein